MVEMPELTEITFIKPFRKPMDKRTKAVLTDYQNSNLAIKNIADKHGISKTRVSQIGNRNGFYRHTPRKASLNNPTA
jgi:DNA-directed RNA polymerase specialized sigma subunit